MRLTLLLVAVGCRDGPAGPPGTGLDDELRRRFDLRALGEIPYPRDNPRVPARIALGKLLFSDPVLSGEKDVACATCHHPDFGFADGRRCSAGVSGVGLGPDRVVSTSAITGQPIALEQRNSPTVLNAAFNAGATGFPSHLGFQFWDGRVQGLEEQARVPITSRIEMAGDAYPAESARDSVVARLRGIAEYVRLFSEAFPLEAAQAVGPDETYLFQDWVVRLKEWDRFRRRMDFGAATMLAVGRTSAIGRIHRFHLHLDQPCNYICVQLCLHARSL